MQTTMSSKSKFQGFLDQYYPVVVFLLSIALVVGIVAVMETFVVGGG